MGWGTKEKEKEVKAAEKQEGKARAAAKAASTQRQGPGQGQGHCGECWTCGQKGHRASECPNKRAAMEIGSVEEDEMIVGGVWEIAQVKVGSEGEAKENKGKDTKKEECEKEVKSDEWEHMKTYLKKDDWVGRSLVKEETVR